MTASIETIDYAGLRATRLVSSDGATAVITDYGAHVLSWIPAGGNERLYLSELASHAGGKAIRGGIPVIFPQFSTRGPLPRHGLVRTVPWQLSVQRTGEDFALATWSLAAADATLAVWPHRFTADLTVSVGGTRLDVELSIENTGDTPLDFTAALHTYLRVDDIRQARLLGLASVDYLDQLAHGVKRTQRGEPLTIVGETDRIYLDAPPELAVSEPGHRFHIQTTGFSNTVVWNPWEQASAAIADMPPLGYRQMLCVEPAVIDEPVVLAPGESWSGLQTLTSQPGKPVPD